MSSPVGFRCHTFGFLEDFGKITLVVKACGQGDIDNTQVGFCQKVTGVFNLQGVEIVCKGYAHLLLEQGGKIGSVDVEIRLDIFQ